LINLPGNVRCVQRVLLFVDVLNNVLNNVLCALQGDEDA